MGQIYMGLHINFTSWEDMLQYTAGFHENYGIFLMSLCAVFCWGLWLERNKRVFKGGCGIRLRVLFRTILSLFQFLTGNSSGLDQVFRDNVVIISN
jgi:hypothetical protein